MRDRGKQMAQNYDVAVIGLGAFGASILYQLARRSVRVVGIDLYVPPHDRGASHGETRITRQAIGEGEIYSPLAIRSQSIWRELEEETDERLFLDCGFAAIDSSGGVSNLHGRTGFVDRTIEAAVKLDIAHEVLNSEEARYRYPGLLVPYDSKIYFESGGGLVFPERCIKAQLSQARRHGAVVHTGEEVTEISSQQGSALITTRLHEYRADQVIVAAGGWAKSLLAGPATSQLRLLRQTLHWFEATHPEIFDSAQFPTFIWTHGKGIEDSFYGFPNVQGLTRGVKVATEQYGDTIDHPEALQREVSVSEASMMHAGHVLGRLAGVTDKPLKSVACFYSQTPDADFIIGPASLDSRVTLVSACSGHGFKHSAGVGEMIAEHLCGKAEIPAQFSPARQDGVR